MNIIFSSDDNYAPLMGVAIYSILEKNKSYPDIIDIYIMDMNISKTNKSLIKSLVKNSKVKITFLCTDEIHNYLENTIKLSVRSLATYYRLFLPKLLPNDINKVIYIDCDVLITNSLNEFWDTNIENYDIAGVLDIISNENKKCIGLEKDDVYFNAGILLINLKKWRKDNIQQKMIDFIIDKKGKVCYHDQGTINGVCLQKKILHPKFNAMTPFFVMKRKHLFHYHKINNYYTQKELLEASTNPTIIHFTPYLTDRPWVKNNLHPKRVEYNNLLNQTPWKGTQFKQPSKTLEPWVKWLFYFLPYPLFIVVLRSLQKFKPKTWIRNISDK